jgi:tRNA-dihydrouridine synthase 4
MHIDCRQLEFVHWDGRALILLGHDFETLGQSHSLCSRLDIVVEVIVQSTVFGSSRPVISHTSNPYTPTSNIMNEASSSKSTRAEPGETKKDFANLPEPLVLPPGDLLANYETINVLAPLVRCSKLPFRHLCSLYETHITHTPMILAEEFSRSQTARISDFSTSVNERGVFWVEPRIEPLGQSSSSSSTPHPHRSYQVPKPHNRLPPSVEPPTKNSKLVRGLLLAQFASPNAASLADAAELIAPYIDGLDINCGCPQKWAYYEGIGCALLRKPELVADMIRCTKDRLGWGWPVSIKIRIDPEEQ